MSEFEETDFVLDDFHTDKPVKKKKVNSGVKGKNGERQLCKILNERFADILKKNPSWGGFNRSVGSGNRRWQTNLSKKATELYSGDIVCDHFNFTIESKCGYDIDFIKAFEGNKAIDEFLKQAEMDAGACEKKPMLIWKKDHQIPLVFLKHFPIENLIKFEYSMHYRDWTVVSLEELLSKMNDQFFFGK